MNHDVLQLGMCFIYIV